MQKATSDDRTRRIVSALVLVAPLLLCACTTTPRTTFNWGVNERIASAPYHREAYSPPPHDTPHRAHPVAVARTSPHPRPAWYETTPQDVEPAQAVGSAHFQWPVEGHVILPFGPTPSGGRNDGINIAAQMDAPIRASEAGTVVYAQTGPKGYGNLILIEHGHGYITAYAHADRLAVSKGDRVAQGQVIGYAGDTGGVSAPQVHFEIRHGGKPLDPSDFLTVSG